jgi:hypothetical protein
MADRFDTHRWPSYRYVFLLPLRQVTVLIPAAPKEMLTCGRG